MPPRRERSRYQLPLELAAPRHESSSVYRAILDSLAADAENNRFVRVVHDQIVVRSPADAATHLMQKVFVPFERLDQEELWILLLSTRNRITHEVMLYRGTVDMVPVRPAEVFKEAIRINSAAILLAHNHPSGEPQPSPQDVRLTETIVQAGEMLGIPLLDHLIVGHERWISLREQKLGFASAKGP